MANGTPHILANAAQKAQEAAQQEAQVRVLCLSMAKEIAVATAPTSTVLTMDVLKQAREFENYVLGK